ncbi:hypothetical protein BJ875DRAFT_515785 [Amylocarpus encephaloides]|uniref:Uncharacterized protein n=1 Tax=Amylocarpus encephaloides TaxID=45428 RepID=A0A9P7YQS7_9HELO|nr:hypothetical protein BJ875DRAFT_515785 [Amylocarpus encephaloides]
MSPLNPPDSTYELQENTHDKSPERPQHLEPSAAHFATHTTTISIEAQPYVRQPHRYEKYCGCLTLLGIFGVISFVVVLTAILWVFDEALHVPGPSANVTGVLLKPRQVTSLELPATLSKFHKEQVGGVTTVSVDEMVSGPLTTVVLGRQADAVVTGAPLTGLKGAVVTSTTVAVEYTIKTVTASPSTTTVPKNASPKHDGLAMGWIGAVFWAGVFSL